MSCKLSYELIAVGGRMCDEHNLKHVHGMLSSEIKKAKSDQSATCVENLQRIETTIAVLHVL